MEGYILFFLHIGASQPKYSYKHLTLSSVTGVFMAEGYTWYNEVVINRYPELSEFFFARDLQESEEK